MRFQSLIKPLMSRTGGPASVTDHRFKTRVFGAGHEVTHPHVEPHPVCLGAVRIMDLSPCVLESRVTEAQDGLMDQSCVHTLRPFYCC